MLPVFSSFIYFAKQRLPITKWLPLYTGSDAVSDVVAGITVGLTLMPQAIAYAALAGLGPQYGLYSGWIGCLVYIVLGSTRQICIGPTALVSLLTYTYTHDTSPDMAALLCFLSGCVELICGCLQLGFLVDFVSVPVVSGFTSAAAVIIASSQMKGLFGLKYNAENFITTWIEFFKHCGATHLWDLVLGLFCIVFLLSLKQLPKIKIGNGEKPLEGRQKLLANILWFTSTGRNAMIVLASSVIAYIFHQHGHTPFTLTGHIQSGLPTFGIPPFSTYIDGKYVNFFGMVQHLGSGIIVVPLIAIISNIAISKAFSSGERVDATQEMIALGFCNIIGSCGHSMPVAGAFSRSAVNNASGVRTTMGGLYTCTLILLALGLLTPYFYYIPRTTLAAVIMCAVLFMVEVEVVRPMWSSNRRNLVPALSTFLACLCVGVEIGLLVGIVVDLVFLLYYNARPKMSIERVGSSPVYWLIQPRGALLFPAVDHIRQTIVSKAAATSEDGDKPRAVVIDCTHIIRTDFTAAQGIQSMSQDVKKQGLQCILLNASPKVIKSLTGLNQDLWIANSTEELLQHLTSHNSLVSETKINGISNEFESKPVNDNVS
uniref:STAS domain-containing protein n=2 Tax=Clastoptera arizonana TaxID=38151 RepID=A0A1B6C3Z6_9HEMI